MYPSSGLLPWQEPGRPISRTEGSYPHHLAFLLDSNLLDDQQNLAGLQRDTQELGVAFNDGAKTNSGDDCPGLGRDRENGR
jgi:hypothetical protein